MKALAVLAGVFPDALLEKHAVKNNLVLAPWNTDSISSRFNVLYMPISTTAPIDAKLKPMFDQFMALHND
jgi:hypothetical protein